MGLRSAIAAWLSRAPEGGGAGSAREAKSYPGPAGTLLFTGADAGGGPERSFEALAREGFMRNPVVHRSVRLICENAAAAPLLLYDGAREVETHPILDLLRRPDGAAEGVPLVERLCGHLVLSGNAFLEALAIEGRPRALHALRPDQVRIVAGRDGWPEAYEHRVGAAVRRIAVADDGPGPLLHLKLFHPLDDGAGFAPLGACNAQDQMANCGIGREGTGIRGGRPYPAGV